MEQVYDVLVIGAGVAGTAAALAAAESGARCCVVRAAPGATAVTAGGWRGERVPPRLVERLAAAGLPLVPCDSPLAHAIGELRGCTTAPPPHAAATLEPRTLVLGIAGLPQFHAPGLATLWGAASGHALVAETVMLTGTPAAGWSPAALAAALERAPDLLASEIGPAARRAAASRVIVPAVLGIDEWSRVHTAVERAAGVPVGEALAPPPSLPGLRLQRALERALHEAGVELVTGRVTGRTPARDASARTPERDAPARSTPSRAARTRGTLASITIAGPTGTVSLYARAWVLATGRFVGGGIVADPEWRETALGVPLRVEHLGAAFRSIEPLTLSDPDRTAPQAWLHVGVRVDTETRPLTADGEPLYGNVHAAGAVIAGPPPALGDAARSGWDAGERAAASAAATANASVASR